MSSGVTFNIQLFKEGRDQLNPEETDDTANMAVVRMHIEHASGRIKNYYILDGNYLLSMTSLMNQVSTIRSYLNNYYHHLYHQMKRTQVNI